MLCYLKWIVVVTSTDDADNDDVSDDNDYNIQCIYFALVIWMYCCCIP